MKGYHKRIISCFVLFIALSGCGAKPDLDSQGDTISPSKPPSVTPRPLKDADPESIRAYLKHQEIANGDIYLKDGLLHINIVNLTPELEQQLAEEFKPETYRLVSVAFSIQQLEEAQQQLADNDFHHKLNVYGSSIDVINNRVEIIMPDDNEDIKSEIEAVLDPKLIRYSVQTLGEPHSVGTISKVDVDAKRILILEYGQKEPSIFYSFNDFSKIINLDGADTDFNIFSKGQPVKVWSTGMVAESFPAQGTARRVALITQEEASALTDAKLQTAQ
ncbi:hypothetical protein SY83_21490 [Paenibacillus swuensis]|uniref:NolW-like domain-containing protein n=1 Tax=Paenibacillus swuensis TaxID=1178515 RepID=A0A172TNN3_9BACL|nr:DUF3221 domain-containing protein [Paenibacillus swuensis]ANE48427.1 hypothetical protein SY83_21490 [Paenibacillus swuensis]